jgi:hypothetical protein
MLKMQARTPVGEQTAGEQPSAFLMLEPAQCKKSHFISDYQTNQESATRRERQEVLTNFEYKILTEHKNSFE